MSNTIENRVVQMKFDNKDFEKNVKVSLQSLEDLKKGLDLDKSAKSLSALEQAVSGLDFSKLDSYLDAVMSKFSLFGRIGSEAFDRVASAVVNAGQAMAQELAIAPVSEGFGKYQTQIQSLQTILYSTGKPIEEVKKVLGELQDYSDETSYSLTDMTSSLAQMMNTLGPERLDDAVVAIKGIDNLAAAAGKTSVEAQRAQYNIGQAMSVGYMQKIDWKSIENAGMATMEFKEQLLEAAVAEGKLTKNAKGQYRVNVKGQKKVEVTAKNLSETLKYQWMTTDVLLHTFEQYGNETTEIGAKAFKAAKETKTFGEMLNYLKDSISSGWMTSFELVIGDYAEATALWTNLADNVIGPIFDDMTTKRNDMLKAWKEHGGRDQLLEAFNAIWEVVSRISDVITEAWTNIFPEMTWKDLLGYSDAFRDWALNLKEYFNPETEEGARRLDNISAAVEGVAKILDGAIKFFGPLLKIIGDFIVSLSDPALELLGFLGEELGTIGEGLAQGEFFTALTDSLIILFDYVTQNAPAIVQTLKDFWANLTEWFKNSGIEEDIGNALKNIASFLVMTVPVIMYYAGELFGFLWELFNSIDFEGIGKKLQETFKPVKEFFDEFGGILKRAIDQSIAVDTSQITDPLEKIKAKLAPFAIIGRWIKSKIIVGLVELSKEYPIIGEIFLKLQGIVDRVKNFIGKLTLENVKKKFEELKGVFKDLKEGGFEKLGKFKEGLVGKFKELLGAFGGVGEEIKKNLANFPTWAKEKAIEIGTAIAGIINWITQNVDIQAVLKIAKGVATIRALWGLGDALGGLGAFLKDKTDGGDIGDVFLKIAGSIALIVGCMYVIAGMDGKDIIKAGVVLGIIAAAIVGISVVMKLLGAKGGDSGFADIGKGMLGLAAGLWLLQKALVNYAKMDADQLNQGILAIAKILVVLALFSRLSGKGGGVNFLGLSIGLLLLMVPLNLLARMDDKALNKGIKALSALMLVLALSSKIAGGAGSFGSGAAFVGMAVALDIMLPVLNRLAEMDTKDIVKSVGGISAILLAFGVMTRLAGKMSFGSALGLIGVMAVAMMSITYGLTEVVKSGADPDAIAKFASAFSKIIVSMGAAVLLMGGDGTNWAAGIKAGANLAEFIAVLAGILAVLGATMETAPWAWDLVQKGGEALELIGEALGKAIGGLIKGIFGTNNLEGFQTDLTTMGDTLKNFGTQMEGFEQASIMEAVGAMKELGLAAAAIPSSGGIIQKIIGEKDIGSFATDLPLLGKGIRDFADNVKDVDTDKVTAVANAGKLLTELNNELPRTGGKLQEWIGEKDLGKFGTALGPLGVGVRLFGNLVKDVDTDKVTAAANAAKVVAELNNQLPPTGGVLQGWLGTKDLAQFATNLTPLGRGIKDFSTEIKGVNTGSVTNAANAAKTIAELAKGIPRQGGGLSYLIGDHDLSKFSTQLKPLGEGISEFAVAIKGVDTDSVTRAAEAAKVLAVLAKGIPAEGGFLQLITGEQSLSTFGNDLPTLGSGLAAFTTNLEGVSTEQIALGIAAIQEVVKGQDAINLLSSLALDYNGIYGQNLSTIASGIADFSTTVGTVNVVQASAAIGLVKSLGDMLKTFDQKSLPKNAQYAARAINTLVEDSEFMGSVTTLASTFIRGLDAALQNETMPGSTTIGLATGVGDAIVQSINNFYNKSYQAGVNLMAGLRAGINASYEDAVSAMETRTDTITDVVPRKTEQHSPSKLFYRYGANLMYGLANGVRDYGYLATNQTAGLADNVITVASDALDMVSYLMETDPSMAPVITPIFDMSNYRRGIDAIDTSRLNGHVTLGGYSRQLGYEAMSTSPVQMVDTILGMSDQIASLGEAIQQMQIVMDTGALVGQIAGEMDKRLGARAIAQARRG